MKKNSIVLENINHLRQNFEFRNVSTDIEQDEFKYFLDREIRSKVRVSANDRSSPNYYLEVTGDAILKALDIEPLWVNHLLTKRRPNIAEMSFGLAQSSEWMDDHLIVPFEDLVVVIRFKAFDWLEVCAIVTVEPVYAAGEVGYWLRCSIYEGSRNTSLLVGGLRSMASLFGTLDYPDANLIDRLGYSLVSKTAISAYARHPARTQTLFLIPKKGTDTRSRKVSRFQMAEALLPFGVVGELSLDGIKEISDLNLPRDVCAIALPPPGSSRSRIVLEATGSKDPDVLNWAGMAEYLTEIYKQDAPWLSDSYEMQAAQNAAVQYANLVPNRVSCTILPYPMNRALAEHIRSTTEEPGWDLYSPLPMENTTEPPMIEVATDLATPETETPAETFGATLSAEDVDVSSFEDELENGYPLFLADLPNWVERELGSAIEIAPRAVRETKKFRHPHPERIAQALELLAGPRLATFRGDRSAFRAFHQGLVKLRMRDGFSGAERLAGRTGSDYLLKHQGKTFFLDRHLASNSSGFNDPKMIRIYYVFDHSSDKVIVGWLPTHLQTSNS